MDSSSSAELAAFDPTLPAQPQPEQGLLARILRCLSNYDYDNVMPRTVSTASGRLQLGYIHQVLQHPERARYWRRTFKNVIDVVDRGEVYQTPPDPRYTVDAAEGEENVYKNRYTNIIPFDRNRVPLVNMHNDYINASFISMPLSNSTERDPAYIATQGPTKESILDFWRMVYQREANLVLCLSQLVESGRPKVDQYWIDNGSFLVPIDDGSQIQVTHVATETPDRPGELLTSFRRHIESGRRYKDNNQVASAFLQLGGITLRKFDLDYRSAQGTANTQVWHLFSSAWPDHGVIAIDSLLTIVELSRFINVSIRNPLVVHCSAGCGRTGTFIAVDFLTRYLEDGLRFPEFDAHPDLVAAVVADLRRQRVQMVQALRQFELVYESVARYLELIGIK
ncbi:hypothetical protein AMAG_01916 [Allomyces macrogynus ATCC 38327]|uniref:Protein-tyrosine phosphatase n=1 Tax=Allomyces macrogynus (strain ATCC 38327) TaxID=578462 RepID=A0A0L0S139_ALLM3|nr:hypothetical protein AMAG_01916 [Allomyces macrogynus ATCC 38327]|eukprot:KNE56074.1 hypothetical protein AMAG_01916 [Allomyces macrogynus ATCC 38327]